MGQLPLYCTRNKSHKIHKKLFTYGKASPRHQDRRSAADTSVHAQVAGGTEQDRGQAHGCGEGEHAPLGHTGPWAPHPTSHAGPPTLPSTDTDPYG